MKKHFIFFVALFFTAQISLAASVTAPADIPAYWASVDGKSGATLWSAVSAATGKNFKSIGYNGLYSAYLKTDVYPADSVGKAGKIWDMYGECVFASTNTCGNYNGVCDCYNREHSIPQSWWGGGTGGIGNDIFHVLPTDGKINGVRSNYEYGEVNGGTNWRGNKYGSAGSWSTDKKTIASSAGETVNGSGNVFEPKPQYKGDWARGIMGTIVKWQQSNLTTGNNFFSGTYTASGYYGLTKKAVVLLMKWHREDPVSQKEIDRNNGIQATQGNRNPFIDYPYLAEYIWGEHAGETIDMDLLMPSTDPDFVPGVSDGSRTYVPPVPGAMYGVTWSANGEVLSVDSIAEEAKISVLPSDPTSCSKESSVFMGWTEAPISGTKDEAPSPLYTKAADFPAVTQDVTYYAVFAKEEAGGSSTPTTYTFDAEHQEGWANTASKNGSYWLLDQGKTLVSPAIDLAGLESITVKMRTYGGTQYDMLEVREESGVLTSIEATAGSTPTEYTWNNNLYIAGTSTLTFLCSNGASGKGIGVVSVVINATGTGSSYSRYITSCQGTTEFIDPIPEPDHIARKIIIGGQIYIVRDAQIFTIQGQRVK
jgi:endonuclease I